MDNQISVGTFFLLIRLNNVWDRFLVDNFLLSKGVGKLSSLTVDITDSTEISTLLKKTVGGFNTQPGRMDYVVKDAIADDSLMRLCKLVLFIEGSKESPETRLFQWFTGRLCTIAPRIDTSTGIQIGMTCYCLSKACELGYRPFVDFVYTPVLFASDINMLHKGNVFYPEKITNSLYSASAKLSTAELLRKGNILANDTIPDMLAKALNTLQSWLKLRGTAQLILASKLIPAIHLLNYIAGNVLLSPVVKSRTGTTMHPYVKSLIEDFMGSMQNNTIFDSLVNTLKLNGRLLTFIPPRRDAENDILYIIPHAITKFELGDVIGPDHIISFSVSTNPLLRIREPDKIFVKAAFAGGWGAQDAANGPSNYKLASLLGEYSLSKQRNIRRIKLLYAPKWLFDIILQGTYNDKELTLVQEDLYALWNQSDPQEQSSETSLFLTKLRNIKDVMNAYAQNMFYSTYRMHTYANIKLAITDYTLDLDSKLGKSIKVSIPISALDTTAKNYSDFYGRLLSILYTYQAAKTNQSLSSLSLSCTLSGLTAKDSLGSVLYEEGNNILYLESEHEADA